MSSTANAYVRDCLIDTCHDQDRAMRAYVISCINALEGHVCLTKPEVMLVVQEEERVG